MECKAERLDACLVAIGAASGREKAKEIIEKHIKGGAPVTEYTIGAAKI